MDFRAGAGGRIAHRSIDAAQSWALRPPQRWLRSRWLVVLTNDWTLRLICIFICTCGWTAQSARAQVTGNSIGTSPVSVVSPAAAGILGQASGRIGGTGDAGAGANPSAGAGAGDNATAQTETAGLLDIVFSGGWVGALILLALLTLSLFAVYLIIEQALVLRQKEVMPTGLADEVRQLLSQGRLPDADAICRQRASPLAFVLISGLSELDFGWAAMEKAMEDAVAEQAAKLYRKIEYLSVIGNLAPMCGLLGTVTGMIFAFQQVAVSQGQAGASELAEGIYSALVTTVAGLVVAIPSLGAFAIFRNRIDQLIAETAYLAQHVFSPLRRRATKVASRPPQPATQPPQSPSRGG